VCYRCGQLGHLANRCTNNAAKSGVVTKKKCNQCFVSEPKGVLTHQGEIFPIFFDSGAECSLIRSSVARWHINAIYLRINGKFYPYITETRYINLVRVTLVL